jgi:hypothetical protein
MISTVDSPSFVEAVRAEVKALLRTKSIDLAAADPSEIWSNVSEMLSYVLSLDERHLKAIRYHTAYLTGSTDVMRFTHSAPGFYDPQRYAEEIGYVRATNGLPLRLRASEPLDRTFLNPAGLVWQGLTLNSDIARYQECITDLFHAGLLGLDKNGEPSSPRVILEIGGGYGGLVNQLTGILMPGSTLVVCDLPLMLFYSAVFLYLHHPNKKILFCSRPPAASVDLKKWDIVLTSPEALSAVFGEAHCDLGINMMSFQEMTEEQIEWYCDFLVSHGASALYSSNKERHPCNEHLGSLTGLFERKGYRLFPDPGYYDRHFDRSAVHGFHTTRTHLVSFKENAVPGDFVPVHEVRTSANRTVAYHVEQQKKESSCG